MERVRMPACVDISLDGELNASVLNTTFNEEKPNKKIVMAQGNRCGHNKNSFKKPSFIQNAKRRPHAIEEAKRRIYASLSDINKYPEFTKVFYLPLKNNKGRRRRSESREGCFSLALPTLIHTLNLEKMASGWYDNRNQFHYYDYGYLANQTDQKSHRIKREMAILQYYDIIKVVPIIVKNHDGSPRTKEVRIEFTDKIFDMLEMTEEFLTDREKVKIKFFKKQQRLDENRKKKEFYAKPYFNQKPLAKKSILDDNALNKITKPYKAPNKGRGQQIKEAYGNLIAKGLSPSEAIAIIRNTTHPPG